MCMITYLPANVAVPYAEILQGSTYNDDGHGWAIAAEIGVMLSGHYLDATTALETFRLTREAFPNAPAMFHSRFATHGTVSLANVHPFTVGKYAAVAHNGILPTKFQPSVKGDTRSDTAIMAEAWLAGRSQTSGIWTRRERQRIGRIIGAGNKLCILSVSPWLDKPKGYLVNAAQGNWHRGAWFSNHDWEARYSRHVGKGLVSGAWWDDDDLTLTARRSLQNAKDLGACPVCKSDADIDATANMCLYCDTCLDCYQYTRACTCGDWAATRNHYECLTCGEEDTRCNCAKPQFAEVTPSGDVVAWNGKGVN